MTEWGLSSEFPAGGWMRVLLFLCVRKCYGRDISLARICSHLVNSFFTTIITISLALHQHSFIFTASCTFDRFFIFSNLMEGICPWTELFSRSEYERSFCTLVQVNQF